MSKKKQYVVRKFIEAGSIKEVLKLERKVAPHEIFLKDEPEGGSVSQMLGFTQPPKV